MKEIDNQTLEILVRLVGILGGDGPFTGLWPGSVKHLHETCGFSEEEIEAAMEKAEELAYS